MNANFSQLVGLVCVSGVMAFIMAVFAWFLDAWIADINEYAEGE